MPAFLTHILGADDVLEELDNPRIKNIIRAHEDAFYSGTQGGDYYQLYKNYSMWAGYTYKMFGYALHRARPQRFFCEGADYIKQHPSDLIKAFFFGYITHYAFDMYMHPYINKGTNPMTTHNTLECAIDVMYAHKRGIDALEFNKGDFVAKTLVKTNEINEFYDAMKAKLYEGFTLKPNSYHTTYRYLEKFERLLYKPSKKRIAWMRFRNLFMILNRLTLLYHPVEEIKDWYDYEFYFGLIKKAVKKSVEWIELVDAYWNDKKDMTMLQSSFYNVDFNGKAVVPREERKTFQKMYKKAKMKW